MSDAARRKEKKRLKREKKRAEHRRAMAGSPYKRIAEVGAIHACYITEGWQTSGMASIHFMRVNPQGGFAMACFLIDLWCAGLKDAWGSLDMHQEDVDWHLEQAERGVPLERIDPQLARQLVAGAIRYARQNGFRLPGHYDRWVNLLGEVPAPSTADLRPFGRDGRPMWVGTREDLQSRLIGCSVEDFLTRAEADFVSPPEVEDFGDFDEEDDEEMDEDEIEEAWTEEEEKYLEVVDEIYEDSLAFCARCGETPLPDLYDGARLAAISMLTLIAQGATQPEPDQIMNQANVMIEAMYEPEDWAPLKTAVQQIFRVLPNPIDQAEPGLKAAGDESPSRIVPIDSVPEIP
jgi:hypothetical protein